MIETFAILLSIGCLSAVFVAAGCFLTYRFTPEANQPQIIAWLRTWGLRGLLVPAAIWALMNLSLSWNLQPFMPQVQAAQVLGGPWFPEFISVQTTGVFVLSSYWSAVTVAWLLVSAFHAAGPEARKD